MLSLAPTVRVFVAVEPLVARAVLEEEGYRVRALSFTEDGLVAYVEERG